MTRWSHRHQGSLRIWFLQHRLPEGFWTLSACGSSDSEVTRTQKLVLRPVTVLCMQTTICWCWHTRAGKAWMKIRTECHSVNSRKKFTYVITNREVCTALTQGSGWQLQPLGSVQADTIYHELTWNHGEFQTGKITSPDAPWENSLLLGAGGTWSCPYCSVSAPLSSLHQ